MLERINKFIKSCDLCQKNKILPTNKLPMRITTTSNKPFEKIFLDIVGPISSSLSNNRFILTIQDDLSKYSMGIPIPNQEVVTIAQVFVERFICMFGAPDMILTDQGSNFMAQLMKEICKFLKIKKLSTSAYHPQSDGALERSHRTLGEYLRIYTNGDPSNWDTWLPFAMFCYNSTPHSSTEIMPFEILYGFKPTIPSSVKSDRDVIYNYDDYLSELRYRLQTAYSVAKSNCIEKKEKNKTYYDKKAELVTFKVDDLVLLQKENRSTKLDSLWTGPHKIIEILSDTNSKILIRTKLSSGKFKYVKKVVHNNRIKIYSFTDSD